MIKLYLKIFFVTGVFFSLWISFAGLGRLATMPQGKALAVSLIFGAIFGLLLSLIMGTLHILKVRKIAGESREGDIYATTQRREIKSALSGDRLFTMLTHYLKEVARFSLTGLPGVSGKLEAVSRVNLVTFGSRVTITIAQDERGASAINVSCKPRLMTTLVDYGESLKIVSDIARYLRESEHRG